MRVRVESHIDRHGQRMPRALCFGGRRVRVLETLDQWHESDYRYVKVGGDDGALYVVRVDDARSEGELIVFERAEMRTLSTQSRADNPAVSRQRPA